jgi:hypothetical protein
MSGDRLHVVFGVGQVGRAQNPLQLGATVWHFRRESRVTSPPVWVQNLMLPPLAALAKMFGVHPHYDRWDSRMSAARPTPSKD